jgi:hypothetical protein
VISAICNFVNNPSEPMPAVLVVLICDLADATCPPLTDRTYQGGARYVAEIIERRRPSFLSRHGWRNIARGVLIDPNKTTETISARQISAGRSGHGGGGS